MSQKLPLQYNRHSFLPKNVDAIMRETDGRGVDVMFDTIVGKTLSRTPDTQALLERSFCIIMIPL
ncbi:hypothetical protein [Paenibacillus taichungensis]